MEKLKISERVSLLYLPNPQLKVAVISVYFRRPLSRTEVTFNSLIPDVLSCGTKRLETETEIDKELQGLYGAKVSFNTIKVGEKQIMAFKLLMCADKYLPEPVLEKGLGLLKEMIFDPFTVDGGFSPEYVAREKEVLKEDILAKINNKGSYAIDRCVTNMCKDEVFSIADDGYIEDLENINAANLYEQYENIISTSPIDIVVVGDLDFDKVKTFVIEEFLPKSGKLAIIAEDNIVRNVKEVKYIKESMDVSQGKLVIGYRTGITAREANYYDMFMYVGILGSGVSSKLFRNVREKHSLCYSIGASQEKFKGLMFVTAGIDFDKYELALKLIGEQVEAMSKGDITEEELEATRLYLINSLRSVKDAPNSLADFYFSQSLQDSDDDVDAIIKNVEAVTKEGIVGAAQGVKLDTVYFLTNEEVANENN